MSTGWSVFIIVLTMANILGCLWLLWWTSKQRANDKASDTTGHVWDEDLVELNNPLPRWWLILFYLTVIFSLGYLALYPGLGNYAGLLNWTQESRYEAESALIENRKQEMFAQFKDMDIPAMALHADARDIGSRLFGNNCAVCHGSDGRGAPGFPNLADGEWQFGGEPKQIVASITQGRKGVMPPFAAVLGERGVAEVAAYVYQLNGRDIDVAMQSMVATGKQKFAASCAACHGNDAGGNIMLGAPNLANDAWLYGGSFDAIKRSIANGRSGDMPAHDRLLSDDEIRLIAAYVYGLAPRETL